MSRRNPAAVAAAFLAASLSTGAAQAAAQRVMVVFDASGSMWGQVEGRTKIEIAREVLGELVADFEPGASVGLVAYGHRRKGDCDDIEVLVPAEGGSPGAVAAAVRALHPKGKTPLTAAVRRAAEALRYEEDRATVILVSDGEETCDLDPCAVGAELALAGVDFTAHVIGFAVPEEERAGLRCLAEGTGGLFLAADDAGQLRAALTQTVAEAAAPPPPPPEAPGEASLAAPERVAAGSRFEVSWQGPDAHRDYVAVVEPAGRPARTRDHAYTERGNPATLRAPDDPGGYELRYVFGPTREVLASRPLEVTPVEATIAAPASVVAGAPVEIEWTGPDNHRDFLTIVPAGADQGRHGNYQYTNRGNPVEVAAPVEPGDYEIRYLTGQQRRTLATAALRVTAAAAGLEAPAAVDAGGPIPVTWTGPDNHRDFVTVVAVGAAEGKHGDYQYTSKGNPSELRAPDDAGSYELRYVTGQDRKTLASRPIEVEPVGATLELPASAPAGSSVEVAWTGPDHHRDFLTIVAVGTDEGKHGNYQYASKGNPSELLTPEEPGEYEVRYVTGQSRRTLARRPIVLDPVTASLEVPASAPAGGKLSVAWQGPDHHRDFVTIVAVGTEEGKHGPYQYTRRGSPLTVDVPAEPGAYEVRYVTGQERRTLARAPLRVE